MGCNLRLGCIRGIYIKDCIVGCVKGIPFLFSSYLYPRRHFCSLHGANSVKQYLTFTINRGIFCYFFNKTLLLLSQTCVKKEH